MHNLATINGRIAMSYQGNTPWHQLGTRVRKDDPAAMDPLAALAGASLAWDVEMRDLFLADGSPVPMRKAIVRTLDNVILGTGGTRYTPIQNAEGFGILTEACHRYGLNIASVGGLGQGERIWMLVQMPETMEVTHGDNVKGYFLLTLTHDGSGAFKAKLTPIRVVCQNTLNAAMGDGTPEIISIRHTASAPVRIREAERMVTRMIKAMEHTQTTFQAMASKRMSRADVEAFIASVFPVDPKAEKIPTQTQNKREYTMGLVTRGKGADLAGARPDGSTTVWGAYNAVTEYFDHVRPALSSKPADANESALFGSGAAIKAAALALSRKLIAA